MLTNKTSLYFRLAVLIVTVILSAMWPQAPASAQAAIETVTATAVVAQPSNTDLDANAAQAVPDDPTKFELWFDAKFDQNADGPDDSDRNITSEINEVRLFDETGKNLFNFVPNDQGTMFPIDGYQGTKMRIEFELPASYPLFTRAHSRTLGGMLLPNSVSVVVNTVTIYVTTSASVDTYVSAGLSQYSKLVISRWCDSNSDGLQNDPYEECPMVALEYDGLSYNISNAEVIILVYPGKLVTFNATSPEGKDFTLPSEAEALAIDGDSDFGLDGKLIRPFRMVAGTVNPNVDIGIIDDVIYNFHVMMPLMSNSRLVQ